MPHLPLPRKPNPLPAAIPRPRNTAPPSLRRPTRIARRKEARRVPGGRSAPEAPPSSLPHGRAEARPGALSTGRDALPRARRGNGGWGTGLTGHGVCASIPPLREGGGRPVEGLPMESCLRSKWKGRRVEYCGMPYLHGVHFASPQIIDSFIFGSELRWPRRPSAVLPPSRPLPFSFFHPWTSHSWPRHPPLGGGADPGTLLDPCVRGIRDTVPLDRFKK